MFDWLHEGRLSVYLGLGFVAVVLLGLWWRDRRKVWLAGVGLVVALVAGYYLLDRLTETRREQIERKLNEMAGSVKEGNIDRIVSHLSEQFRFRGMNKAGFRRWVDSVKNTRAVEQLTVWDFKFPDESGKVEFRAKPEGPMVGNTAFYRVVAEFTRDSDGQWRLKSFDVFHPFVDSNSPLDIPAFIR